MQIDMKILELVCSRLCHDLVGPVGAVNNGIELLEDFDPAMAEDVLPLLQSSARQAWRRLDLFRIAFGAAGGRENWPIVELRRYAAGWFEDGKVALQWPDYRELQEQTLPTPQAKLLLHLLMIAGEALPRGGTVSVQTDAPEAAVPAVTAAGRSANLHPQIQSVLAAADNGKADGMEMDARSIQAHLATLMAARAALSIDVERGEDRVTLRCLPRG